MGNMPRTYSVPYLTALCVLHMRDLAHPPHDAQQCAYQVGEGGRRQPPGPGCAPSCRVLTGRFCIVPCLLLPGHDGSAAVSWLCASQGPPRHRGAAAGLHTPQRTWGGTTGAGPGSRQGEKGFGDRKLLVPSFFAKDYSSWSSYHPTHT
jgi:hypothetical protein